MLQDWKKTGKNVWKHKGERKNLYVSKAYDHTGMHKKPRNYFFVAIGYIQTNWWREYTVPVYSKTREVSKRHFQNIADARKFAVNYMRTH